MKDIYYRNKHIYGWIAALLIFFSVPCASGEVLDTQSQIFNPNFKTLTINAESNELFPAIITLGSGDRIIISFDEMTDEMQYLRYRLIHCNADWQPSDLVDSEYLDGFNYANIDNYGFSAGTFAHYVHYSFAVPNENMKITKSGNYLIQVYPEDNPDETILQARFSASEGLVNVFPSVSSRTDIDYNSNHQQVSVKVAAKENVIRDWYNDLKVIVSQNSRLDNEVIVNRPLLVDRTSATFDHNKDLIFPAGNEYRRFEVVATNYPGMNVENIEYHSPYYHVALFTDKPRVYEPYTYDSTQHGRFKIRQSSVNDSQVNAYYVIVHFSLNTPQMFGGNLYLDGDLTNHRFSQPSMMKYNPATGKYELNMLMKMGSYNYQYLWVPDGSKVGYTAQVEGNHYQTVNEYLARVYYRPPGERYDRFVGFGIVFSGR